MRITTGIKLRNRRYYVTIDVDHAEFSTLTATQLRRFGEPILELGGAFSGSATRTGDSDPTSVSFELSDLQRRVPSQLPHQQVFDLRDSADADVEARVYEQEIRSRLETLRDELMAEQANFVGTTTTDVGD